MNSRLALAYLGSLLVVCCIIGVVLHYGAALEDPLAQLHAGAAQQLDQPQDILGGLRANLQHPLSQLFVQLFVIIAAARILGSLFTRIGLPAVVGEMAAGIVLGPSLLGLVAPSFFAFVFPQDSLGALRLLSQVGVCFFMFSVGMELEIAHVRSKARAAIAVSHASISAPFLLGVVLAYFLFESYAGASASFMGFALFMGISMSITAFPVLARILQERRLTKTALGSTALACAAVDDVTAWSILAFVVAVARSTSIAASILSLAIALIFILIMTLGVRKLLPRWIGERRLQESEPSSATLGMVVCVVIAAALCTELIGIHALFGAFLAGAIMPDTDGFREKISALVSKFSSVLLLPLFFAFTGLRTEVALIDGLSDWLLCALIIGVATLGKLGASAITARITGMPWRESLQLGALMNTRGLMELIALNIGYDLGILSPSLFTMLVIMALVTTMMTGPLITLFERGRAPSSQTMQID
jgi:Kef-type K+ transport system membrane component KefB